MKCSLDFAKNRSEITYVIDIIKKRLVDNDILPLYIYSFLNTIIIGLALGSIFNVSTLLGALSAFILGLILYAVSLSIALSWVGDWILKKLIRCKKVTTHI